MNKQSNGWLNGFLGVLIFSASLPATRMAVAGFDPVFLTSVRATIAALIGLFLLVAYRGQRPQKDQIIPLVIVAIGVVVGFPFLTALALQHITAAYSIVFIGLLPLATAIFAVLRAGERPSPLFWLVACLGSGLVAGYALTQGIDTSVAGNIYMVGAIIVCGLGYAEGAKLTRSLGGWQVISWALVMSLPIMAPISYVSAPDTFAGVEISAWGGLAYVSSFSMLIGFVFWYRGLAQGGIAAIGQLQLLQPFFGLFIAATVLQETVGWSMVATTIAVVICVIFAKKISS